MTNITNADRLTADLAADTAWEDIESLSTSDLYAGMSNAELQAMDQALNPEGETSFVQTERKAGELPEVTVIPEYAFTAPGLATIMVDVLNTAKQLHNSDQRRLRAAFANSEHERKIALTRASLEYVPQTFTATPVPTDDLLGEDCCRNLLERATLSTLRTRYAAAFTMMTSQFVFVTQQIRDAKQELRAIEAKAQEDDVAPETIAMIPVIKAKVDTARASFKALRKAIIPVDNMVVKNHLPRGTRLQFKVMHAIRSALLDCVIDEADDIINLKTQPGKFIPKQVIKEREDVSMTLFNEASRVEMLEEGAVTRVMRLITASPNYARQSKAQRLDESVYRDTNEVSILTDTTERVAKELLEHFGHHVASHAAAVAEQSPSNRAIFEVQTMIDLLQREVDSMEWYLNDENAAVDENLLDDLRISISLMEDELAAFTSPQCYGNSYALGNGGGRKVYTVPA